MDEATDKAATFWLIFFSSLTIALATNFSTWWGRWKVTVAHWKREEVLNVIGRGQMDIIKLREKVVLKKKIYLYKFTVLQLQQKNTIKRFLVTKMLAFNNCCSLPPVWTENMKVYGQNKCNPENLVSSKNFLVNNKKYKNAFLFRHF